MPSFELLINKTGSEEAVSRSSDGSCFMETLLLMKATDGWVLFFSFQLAAFPSLAGRVLVGSHPPNLSLGWLGQF